jgi:hypothetical protein
VERPSRQLAILGADEDRGISMTSTR